jgi:hypothetical protein
MLSWIFCHKFCQFASFMHQFDTVMSSTLAKTLWIRSWRHKFQESNPENRMWVFNLAYTWQIVEHQSLLIVFFCALSFKSHRVLFSWQDSIQLTHHFNRTSQQCKLLLDLDFFQPLDLEMLEFHIPLLAV